MRPDLPVFSVAHAGSRDINRTSAQGHSVIVQRPDINAGSGNYDEAANKATQRCHIVPILQMVL